MTEAEQLVNEAFLRTMAGWSTILSFWLTMDAGLPAAKATIERRNRAFIHEQLSRTQGSIFVPGKVTADIADLLVSQTTENTVVQAQAAVDAASLVFIHSIVDGAALDYCRATAIAAPDQWEDVLKDRKVGLLDARDSSFQHLFRESLARYFEQLERESLLRKIDLIYRICAPPKGTPSEVTGYEFDRDRLIRLDSLRHDIVHGTALGSPMENAFQELDYMMQTITHLFTMVARRFRLLLDPSYALTYFAKRGQGTA